jgi:DNA-binding transcriptional MerR regulator
MLSSHDRQSTPSSAPEVNTHGGLLTIGELARRAGVTASALRYYEELGLLPPPARISGQRRYPESAARLVGAILLYSDAGFTLAEQKALMATRAGPHGDRSQLMQRKLAELDEQIARAQAVRDAIRHGLRCPHEDITQCPNFNAGITARLAGQPLSRSHQQLHGQRLLEQRVLGFDATHRVVVERDAADAAVGGQDAGLRPDLLGREDPVHRREQRVPVQQLQVP